MQHLAKRCTPLALAVGIAACRGTAKPPVPVSDPALAPGFVCPKEASAPPQLPFERAEHRLAEFWLARAQATVGDGGVGVDELLISQEEIAEHNGRVEKLTKEGWPAGRWNPLHRPLDHRRLAERLSAQLDRLREGFSAKRLRVRRGLHRTLLETLARRMARAEPADELRIAYRSTPLRCMPTRRAVHDDHWIYPFDVMQCSQLRTGEVVRVVRKAPRFWFVWVSYGQGWVDPRALTPTLPSAVVERYFEPERFIVVDRDSLLLHRSPAGSLLCVARLGLRLPLVAAEEGPVTAGFQTRSALDAPGARSRTASQPAGPMRVLAPSPTGLVQAHLPAGYSPSEGYPPLTRAAFFRLAFSLLDTPYGWGGMGDHRDCSRMIMDLFATFGVLMPRNSGQQAKAGMRAIDVGGLAEAEKARVIERAGRQGIVLLYLPGHIMLYVGRDGEQLFALHQFSGYLVPCSGGRETMYRVNRAAVTSLQLGLGSSRRSFLQRIVRLLVYGPGPPAREAPRDAGAQRPSSAKPHRRQSTGGGRSPGDGSTAKDDAGAASPPA